MSALGADDVGPPPSSSLTGGHRARDGAANGQEGASGRRIGGATAAVIVVLAMLAWASVLLPGFAFPWSNNVFHVPIVLGYAASVEGPHDAFTRSLDNFVSGFWPLLRLVATESNVAGLFFAAHLLGRLLFAAGSYAIVRHAGAGRMAALALTGLAAIAPLFKGVSIVGHTETLATYLSHTGFAIAMLPGSWWLMLRGRWVLAAALLGVIFNVNAFISIWSVAAAMAAMVAARSTIRDFPGRLLRCALAYAVEALPTVIWMLSTVTQPSQPIDYRAYLIEYYPLHTFVHLQWAAVARYAVYLAGATLAVVAATRSLRDGGVLAALFAAYLAVFVFGIALPYVSGARLLLNLFPLRIDAVLNVMVAAIMLGWAGCALTGRDRDALPLAIALSLLLGNAVATLLLLRMWCIGEGRPTLARASVVLLAGGLALLVAMGQAPALEAPFVPLTLLFGALVLLATRGGGAVPLVAAALACTFVAGGGYPWPVVGLALAVVVALAAVRLAAIAGVASAMVTCVWLYLAGLHPAALAVAALTLLSVLLAIPTLLPARRWQALAVAPATLLSGVLAIGLALSGYAGWRGSVERPDADLAPSLEAQGWTRRHLRPDEAFLPIGVQGFSVLSRRPAWVDAQAGAAVMWQPDFQFEWRRRMHEVAACADTACFAALARRHGLRWIVAAPGRIVAPEAAGLLRRFSNRAVDIYGVKPIAAPRAGPAVAR